jgi:hypothetical protein
MSHQPMVLLLGGTGRTGKRVMEQLLNRGISVRAIVRTRKKIPAGIADNPNLSVIEASVLSLTNVELQRQLHGCDAVISCLGHVINLRGIFGPPRDLVVKATTRVCREIEGIQPTKPIKFILMSSVSVNQPMPRHDMHRKVSEKVFLGLLRCVIPPANDNQKAADFLYEDIGVSNSFVHWVVVRPDSLLEGNVTEYKLHENIVSSLFTPDSSNMSNVAHFMCELVTNDKIWDEWNRKMPVIINA